MSIQVENPLTHKEGIMPNEVIPVDTIIAGRYVSDIHSLPPGTRVRVTIGYGFRIYKDKAGIYRRQTDDQRGSRLSERTGTVITGIDPDNKLIVLFKDTILGLQYEMNSQIQYILYVMSLPPKIAVLND